jgi:hypothetical protein
MQEISARWPTKTVGCSNISTLPAITSK